MAECTGGEARTAATSALDLYDGGGCRTGGTVRSQVDGSDRPIMSSIMSFLERLDSRTPRLLLAVCIIAALLAVLAERVIYRTSIEAVVNAPRRRHRRADRRHRGFGGGGAR